MRKIVISQKIKEFRNKNGLTQEQVADVMGITAQSVSKWEREECYPDITLLPMLAWIGISNIFLGMASFNFSAI